MDFHPHAVFAKTARYDVSSEIAVEKERGLLRRRLGART